MSWFKVDDGFDEHDKVLDLLERADGLAAVGLWTVCGSMCSRGESGEVTLRRAMRASGNSRWRTSQLADLLVAVGLWAATSDDEWAFHDWADYRDPKRIRDDERRRIERESKRRRRSKSESSASQAPKVDTKQVDKVDGRCPPTSTDESTLSTDVHPVDKHVHPCPVPSRPDPNPSRPDPSRPPPNPPVGGDAGGVRDPVEGLTTGADDTPTSTRAEEVIRVAEDVYRDRHGVGLGLISHRDVRRALDVWRWAESSAPDDPLGLIRSAWTRCADESTADAPWAAFAASPGRWAGERRRKRPGFRRAATPEEFAAQADITDDELMAAARGERTTV